MSQLDQAYVAFMLNRRLAEGDWPLDGQTKLGRGPSFMGVPHGRSQEVL